MKQEYILSAAIYFDDGKEHVHMPVNIKTGFVVVGHRHHNCYAIMKVFAKSDIRLAKELNAKEVSQGFITNTNRYVDRKEGMAIAIAADQLNGAEPPRYEDKLFSEDLY